jgi:hypothetical protein
MGSSNNSNIAMNIKETTSGGFDDINKSVVMLTKNLQEMANKGQEAAKKLKFTEQAKQINEFVGIITDFAKNVDLTNSILGKLGNEGKKTSTLFEKFGLALSDSIIKAIQPFLKSLNEGMLPVLAIIANSFQKVGVNIAPLIAILAQLLQVGLQAIVPVLQELGNIIVFVSEKVGQFLTPLSNLANITSVLVPIITGLMIALGAIKVATLINMIPQLVAGFATWAVHAGTAAVATLSATGPIIGIALAVVAGIATIIALVQSWKELWNAAQVIWKAISDVIVAYVSGWKMLFVGLGKVIWGALTLDKKMIDAGLNDVKGAVTGFMGTLGQSANESVNALGKVGSAIWGNMVNNAKNAASFLQGSLTDTKQINQQITEEEKKLNEQREAFEKDWSKKLRGETASRLELLEDEKKEALAKAEELHANKSDIEAYYDKKSKDLAKETADAKAQIEHEFILKSEGELQRRIDELDDEMNAKLDAARKVNADEAKIIKYYDDQKTKVIQEGEKKRRDEIIKTIQQGLSTTKDIVGKLSGLFNQYYDNRSKEIDANYAAEKKRIMESQMNEEEKKKALDALDADTDKKKKQLAREQAQTNKTVAIFNAVIDTAQAIVSSLAGGIPPMNFIMAALAGAMGAAQIALISAQPLPALASGGIITSSGMALVGEQGPELVTLPQAASVIPLNRPQLNAAGFGGYSTANITLEIDGRALVKQLGTPLRDVLRIKTGLK